MRKILMTITSIIILTIINNEFSNIKQTIISTNNLQINIDNQQNSLFNNQYHYLNNDNYYWITNQSAIDHKFYSYDISALKPYSFNDKLNTFLVDTTGNLVYNPNVAVPDKDKLNIESTRQQMITNCKITTIKNEYNPYSKSQYSDSYFNSDNQKWEYIQQGAIEKHIDISQQYAGRRVQNANNLSENLGLYYIAKAARENKITQTVADNLGIYFISQTSLKGQISDNLTIKILELIIHNENVYNFIKNIPMTINDKNYSLNYIFDENIASNDHQLVEIYYNKWSQDNKSNLLNYYYNNSYNGTSTTYLYYYTDQIKLLNWKKYNNTWNDFVKNYSSISFDNNSYLQLLSQYYDSLLSASQLTFPLGWIRNNYNDVGIKHDTNDGGYYFTNESNAIWILITPIHDGGVFGAISQMGCAGMIWYDNENIYLKFHYFINSINATQAVHIKINLKNIILNNGMQ